MKFGPPCKPPPVCDHLNEGVYASRAFGYNGKYFILYTLWIDGVIGNGHTTPMFHEITIQPDGEARLEESIRCAGKPDWELLYQTAQLWWVNDLGMSFLDYANSMLGDT